MERGELLLLAVWSARRRRYYIDVAEAAHWPLPDGARVICRIDREDRELMMDWAIKNAKSGKKIKALREACLRCR